MRGLPDSAVYGTYKRLKPRRRRNRRQELTFLEMVQEILHALYVWNLRRKATRRQFDKMQEDVINLSSKTK